MTVLIWALAVAGSALILTQSSIASPIRDVLAGAEERLLAMLSALDSKTDTPRALDFGTYGAIVSGSPTRKRLSRVMRCPVAAAHRVVAALSKLATCPMCSGFWLGAFWTHVLLASPWIASAHPRLSAALWLFAGGCAGSVLSACGVATWLFLDEARMAFGLWRYLKTPKEEPDTRAIRIPRYMRAGLANETDSPITCPCGTVLETGFYKCHQVGQYCGVLRGRDLTPLAGTIAVFTNPTTETIVCGCGATIFSGEGHPVTHACDGTTSLDT